ncbi:ribonuclease D [Leifsonia shinshuensis]|jgi:ribonuclease D|uniref:Ribonuclease D n=1 Tax=Leifsonia shinshuensis TaxID=150026 RepID=A0A7G6YBU8_9MICO|nr:ribonuclease D [Leifsonia shinshuensis]MBN8981995.1 ribonuclease D [Hyphomicrobiales bacterium]QNE35963.1 ribonuclease D [Leifsonia shinshuensis]
MQSLTANVVERDIPAEILSRAMDEAVVAWDIETTGLDWRSATIETCQLSFAGEVFVVQLLGNQHPDNLSRLLAAPKVTKLFHHAPFDVRFMTAHWAVRAQNVACTKIAAKIVSPGLPNDSYSLKSSLKMYLGIELDKTERLSDWSRHHLSDTQLAYAARDVAYLQPLLERLQARGRTHGVWELVERSFEYIPTRAALDISGAGDVFTY